MKDATNSNKSEGKSKSGPGTNEKDNGILLVGLRGKIGLLAYLILSFLLLAYLIYSLWPTTSVGVDGKTMDNPYVIFGHVFVPNDARLLLLVMVIGAIGSFIHGATSFIDFSGSKKLEKSWTWWYILRPFIGAFLALVLFFAIKAGLLALGTDTEKINIYTIAIVSALAGMFSKQATNKLSDLFDTLFKSDKEKSLTGKLADETERLKPEITKLVPDEGEKTQDQKIKISGHNFGRESILLVNNKVYNRTLVDSENIVLDIKSTDLEHEEKLTIKILNPPPGGGESNQIEFTVKSKT